MMFLRSLHLLSVLLLQASIAENVPQTYTNTELVPGQELLYDNDQLNTVHVLTPAFWNDSKMTISVSDGIDQVTTSWTFQSNSSDLTGFFLTYRNDKKEHFDSPLLEKTLRQFSLPSLDKELTYTICIHALVNSTEVQQACTVYNENSLKIVVGIMAGVIFLIPCVLALVCLIRKDKRMNSNFERLLECSSNNGTASVGMDTQDQKCVGYINGGCTHNDQIESLEKDSSSVIANIESPKKDSSSVIDNIESSKKNSSTSIVIANIESPKKDSSSVIDNIESSKKNSSTSIVIANIESPKKDSSSVIDNIESSKKISSTSIVIANIESQKKDSSSAIANIESSKKDSGSVIADIESPKKDSSSVIDNKESSKKNSSPSIPVVIANIESAKKDSSSVIANTESSKKDSSSVIAIANIESPNTL